MLEIERLRKVYEDGTVGVDSLDLTVQAGEVFILLGPNGAGKTSTIMMIFDFIAPTSGSITINGVCVQRDPLSAKRHAAYVSENVMLYGNLTARQNLAFFAGLSGQKNLGLKEFQAVFERVGLARNALYRRVRGFSKGMRQRLGIAIAILKNAPLIVLDEPTSGLDPKGGAEFLRIIDQLRDEGRAILMSTHDIFRAHKIADRVGIMDRGRLVDLMDRRAMRQIDLEERYLAHVEASAAGQTSAKVQ